MATRSGTYYTGTVTGQVGSLTNALDAILVTGEGWAIEFTATNTRIYRPPAGTRFRLRVLDTGSTAGGAQEAVVRAAESATNVNTLVDPYPTTAQLANANCVWRKSETADSTTRNYWAWADDRAIVMIIAHDPSSFRGDMYVFGDMVPTYPGDNYCSFLTVKRAGADSTPLALTAYFGVSTSVSLGQTFARTEDGLLKSVAGGLQSAWGSNFIGNTGTSPVGTYPHPRTLDLAMAPVGVFSTGGTTGTANSSASFRAFIPGIFQPMIGGDSDVSSMTFGDTFTDTAYNASSQFIILGAGGGNLTFNSHNICMQTAGDWYSPESVP